MILRTFTTVLLTNLRRNFLRSFLASFGIIIGIAALYFFITVGSGINRFIISKTMQKLPMNMLRVRTTELSLGIIRIGQPSFMKSSTISERSVRTFRNLPGVRKVYPVMNILFPISGHFDFSALLSDRRVRTRYRSDLIMSGAPEELVRDDIKIKQTGFNAKSWPIPVLVSRNIIDIINSGFAGAYGIPKISEKMLLGFRFRLMLGSSTFIRNKNARSVPCRIVGFTRKSEMLGLVMPLAYAKRFNRQYVRGWRSPRYSSVYILARSSDRVAAIADSIEKTGYTVRAEKKVSNLILLVTFLLSVFALVIIVVAAISIFNAFTVIVNQRRLEIGLYRTFGATRMFIKGIFLCEAGTVGLLTGGLGLMLGVFLVRLTWRLIQGALPAFFKQIGTLFPLSAPLLLMLLAGAVLTSVAAALLPATLAGRIQIDEAVRNG